VDGETQKTTRDPEDHHRLGLGHASPSRPPILTEFDLSVIAAPEIIRKNWKATDWDAFLKQMSQHDWYLPPLSHKDGIDKVVGQLVNAINKAANRLTPEIRITEHSRPGYTRKWLNYEMRLEEARNTDSDEDWEAFRQARHRLGRETAGR